MERQAEEPMRTERHRRVPDINWKDHEPCRLAPPEAFSNELADPGVYRRLHPDRDAAMNTGRRSHTVRLVFHSRTAGYRRRPTSDELYDGLRTATPTEKQIDAIQAWVNEATTDEFWSAWTERAYSWRMLAAGLHRVRMPWYETVRMINAHAERLELVEDNALPEWR